MKKKNGMKEENKAEKERKIKEQLRKNKYLAKLEFFWDYYKWFVIIPVLVVIIVLSFVFSYLYEQRDLSLNIALMNTSDVNEAIYAFKNDYATYRNIDTNELPIEVNYNFLHPKVMDEAAAADTTTVASIQKYQAMLLNSKLDVTITTSWVVEAYGEADAWCDLREVMDASFLEAEKDNIFYCKNSKGVEIPMGIRVDDCALLGEFYEEGTPIVTVSAYSVRKEEAAHFIEWLSEDNAD